jgi:hypothetical protein
MTYTQVYVAIRRTKKRNHNTGTDIDLRSFAMLEGLSCGRSSFTDRLSAHNGLLFDEFAIA